MADTLFTLLEMEPVDDFRAVLRRYIEKINPHDYVWWRHPVPETVQLHFCVANTPQKLHAYFTHHKAGTLEDWLEHHPVPGTLAEGAREILPWVRAKALLHRLDREAPPVVTDETLVQAPLASLTRSRFMPQGRKPPSRTPAVSLRDDASLSSSASVSLS